MLTTLPDPRSKDYDDSLSIEPSSGFPEVLFHSFGMIFISIQIPYRFCLSEFLIDFVYGNSISKLVKTFRLGRSDTDRRHARYCACRHPILVLTQQRHGPDPCVTHIGSYRWDQSKIP